MVPRLLAAAVGAGGDGQLGRERAGQHRGVVHLPGRAGRVPRPASSRPRTPSTACRSTRTRMHELAGRTTVPWRDGMRAHGRGAAPRPGAVSTSTAGTGRVRFERCDPEEPPASELLAEMRAELNDVYETFSRLDNPPLAPGGAAAARRRLPRRLRGRRGRGRAEGCGGSATGWRRSSGCTSARPPARVAWPGAPRSARGGRAPVARLRRRPASTPGPSRCTRLRLYRSAGYVEVPPYNDNPFACFWGEKRLRERPVEGPDLDDLPVSDAARPS